MQLLIVDDDKPKLDELKEFVISKGFVKDTLESRSYQSGLESIIKDSPDLILLDMSMPTYDKTISDPTGGRPRPFAGLDIVKEIRRKRLDSKVIVVTQFPVLKDGSREEKTLGELTTTLENEFGNFFLGTIFYKYSEDSWQEPLANLIKAQLAESKNES